MSIDLVIELFVLGIGLAVLVIGVWMRRRSNVVLRSIGILAVVLGALAAVGGLLRAAPLVFSGVSEHSKAAAIPPMSPRQQELIRAVMQGEEVTRLLHDEFWKPLRDAGLSDHQLLSIRDELSRGESAVSAQRYQREAWRCSRLSYDAARVVRTDVLKGLEQSLLRGVRTSAEGSREVETAIGRTRLLLDASAKHGVLSVPGREEVLITSELIATAESSIDAAFARLERLFSPVYLEQR